MATTLAAMKARLGDIDYYILAMKAQELVEKVRTTADLPGWKDLSIEERYQRELNLDRVKKQIAPYLANNPSRFFGAIIVAAMNFNEDDSFEPLSAVMTKQLPNNYRTEAESIGFLTFRGGEVFIPLDGQHRLKAIQFAITGRDEQDHNIETILTPCIELAQEDVTVILVPYKLKRARSIFTHVNLYARKPTTGENIVTNDDDVCAVLAREITNDFLDGRLVKIKGNTLRPKEPYFTTLSIVYNCNEKIIEGNFPGGKVVKTELPDTNAFQLYRKKVRQVWELLLEHIEVFADALSDAEGTGNEKRIEIRNSNLLGRPVAQECLVSAFVRLTSAPTNLSADDACHRLNQLPWPITNENLPVWDRVLWSGGTDGRIITKNRRLTTDLIAYLAGEKLSDEQKAKLLEEYRTQFPEAERASKQLPEVQ